MTGISRPTYRSGFYSPRRGGVSRYPSLWKGNLFSASASLGETGGTLFDQSVKRNNGTLTNMDPATDWVITKGVLALDFDGSNDTIVMPKTLSFNNPNHFTISVWFYSRTTSRKTLFSFDNEASVWSLELNGTGGTGGQITVIVPGSFILASDFLLYSENAWSHVVYSRAGDYTTTKLYVNGVDRTPGGLVNTTFNQPANPCVIGRRSSGSQQFDGLIAEVSVWNRQLSATDSYILSMRPGVMYERASRAIKAPAASPILVTPTTSTLSTARFAPTISTPRLVTPSTASLVVSAFSPSISTPRLATPSVATLSLTTFAPAVTTPRLVTPATLALTTATFAPAVSASRLVTPPTASISIATFAPAVSAPSLVTPPAATLSLAAFAPVVSAPRTAAPATASLVLTGFVPTVALKVTVPRCDLMLLPYHPSIHRICTPQTAAISLATFAPTVTTSGAVTPPTASLSIATFAPAVTAPQLVTPPVAGLSLNAFAPAVSVPRTVTPSTAALSLEQFAPTIYCGKTATPPTANLSLTGFAPTVASVTDGITTRYTLRGTSQQRLSLSGTSAERMAIQGTSQERLTLQGSSP